MFHNQLIRSVIDNALCLLVLSETQAEQLNCIRNQECEPSWGVLRYAHHDNKVHARTSVIKVQTYSSPDQRLYVWLQINNNICLIITPSAWYRLHKGKKARVIVWGRLCMGQAAITSGNISNRTELFWGECQLTVVLLRIMKQIGLQRREGTSCSSHPTAVKCRSR